jgi:hypothetical protein
MNEHIYKIITRHHIVYITSYFGKLIAERYSLTAYLTR